MKLKVNDTVVVITGKDKGKTGKITKVIPKENKVIVAGINTYTKHMKKRDQNQGGVVKVERAIATAKIMLMVNKKATRVGYQITGTTKVRVARETGLPVETK